MVSFLRRRWLKLCIIALVIIGVSSLLLFQRRIYASVLTQQELRGYVQLAVIENDIFIEQTRHILSIIAGLPQVRGTDKAACDSVLADITSADEARYANAGVIGLDGTLWCSAERFTPPIDLSDRAYFKEVIATDGFSVGDYQINKVTHTPTLSFGYPVRDAQGTTKAIAFVSINITWLEDFAKSTNLPPTATLTLMDNLGAELARWPEPTAIGQQAPEVGYLFDRITYIEENLGEVEVHDSQGRSYYVVAAPLKRNQQEGFLHLIIVIPKDNVDSATAALSILLR